MEIIDLIVEESALILTGIFITFISSLIYRITPTGFICAGKFRTKEGAIAIYLITAIVLGLIAPFIYILSDFVLIKIHILSIFGLLILLANFIINQSVPTWKHTSPKTILIYSVSLFLIIVGFLIK